MGATPDGLVSCGCCGNGVLEIKCPYSCRQKDLVEASEDSSFFLCQSEEGVIKLKESHQYYYQVQMQMKFCNVEYCDFVVWNKESWINQRIYAKSDFINDAITKTVGFIKLGILPELVGRWYTKQSLQPSTQTLSTTQPSSTQTLSTTQPSSTQTLSTTQTSSTHPVSSQQLNVSDEQSLSIQDAADGAAGDSWCYCRKGESVDDYMIGCDNAACLIQWFHLSCLHLTLEQVPKGNWLCPECKHLKNMSKRRKYNP